MHRYWHGSNNTAGGSYYSAHQAVKKLAEYHIAEHHIAEHHIAEHHIAEHHIAEHHIDEHHIDEHHIAEHHIDEHHIAEHHIDMASCVHCKCRTQADVSGDVNKTLECITITDSNFSNRVSL